MTAQPMSTSLAKVRKLLPVRIKPGQILAGVNIVLLNKSSGQFCIVPNDGDDAMDRALLIRDAMNGMA